MKAPRDERLRGFFAALALGSLFMIGGYFLVRDDGDSAFGWVMFVLVPIVTGFVFGAMIAHPRKVADASVMCGVLTLGYLLITGKEGLVCVVLVIPLLAFGILIGAVLGTNFRRRVIEPRAIAKRTLVVLMLIGAPLLIATGDRIEEPSLSRAETEVFVSETTIDASIEDTWWLIARMDTLNGERPLLMAIGLPVPYRCELDTAAVGGTRVCRFDGGQINQQITEWGFPRRMGLKITKNTLKGRKWLSFSNASYELFEVPGGTRVVRTTGITTRLAPRWYWRAFERWGVLSEHEFVFNSIQKNARRQRSTR